MFFVFIGAMITSLKPVFFFPNMFLLALFLALSGCGWGMRLSHWQKSCGWIFYAQGKRQRGTERDIKTNIQYIINTHTHTHPTLSPFGKLSGKQDVGQLALCVGPERVVVLLPAQVIKLDLAHVVSSR